MVYEEDKTFKVTDTLITLVSFKRGGVGLVLLGVDQIYFEKRYVWSIDDEKFKLSRFIGKVLSFIKKSESLYWNGIYGETVSVDGSSSLTFGTKLNEELEMFIDLEALSEAKGLLEIILNNSPGLASSKEKCCVPGCSKSIKIDRMRLHVGAHIVRKDTLVPVCGFCGVVCNSPVSIVFSSGTGVNRTYKAFSGCKYFHDFSMKSALNFSKGNPCTNRPVECEACANGSVFWSFDLHFHYQERHPFLDCPITMCEKEREAMIKEKNFN